MSWTENIQGSIKYIMLNPSSRIKVGWWNVSLCDDVWCDVYLCICPGCIVTIKIVLLRQFCYINNPRWEHWEHCFRLFTYGAWAWPHLICSCLLPCFFFFFVICRERKTGKSMKLPEGWRSVWTVSGTNTVKTGSPRRWGSGRGLWPSTLSTRWGVWPLLPRLIWLQVHDL